MKSGRNPFMHTDDSDLSDHSDDDGSSFRVESSSDSRENSPTRRLSRAASELAQLQKNHAGLDGPRSFNHLLPPPVIPIPTPPRKRARLPSDRVELTASPQGQAEKIVALESENASLRAALSAKDAELVALLNVISELRSGVAEDSAAEDAGNHEDQMSRMEESFAEENEGRVEYREPVNNTKHCLSCGMKCGHGKEVVGIVRKGHYITPEQMILLWHSGRILTTTSSKLCSECTCNGGLILDINIPLKGDPSVALATDRIFNNLYHALLTVDFGSLRFTKKTPKEIKVLTRMEKSQVLDLARKLDLRPEDVFTFLYVCAHNVSQRAAAAIQGRSKSAIQEVFHRVLTKLTAVLVPQQLKCARDLNIQQIPTLARQILSAKFDRDDFAVVLADGTYIYLQKSSDFTKSKDTYSEQKGRELVKLMGITNMDGSWWYLYGPFAGNDNHSDQFIWDAVYADLSSSFQPNDIAIVDRGFYRVRNDIFTLLAPVPCAEGRFDQSHSNHSRLVTRLRNVNERANGRLKQWKILLHTVDLKLLLLLGDLTRALAAIENAYFPPLFIEGLLDASDAALIAERSQLTNYLGGVKEATTTISWKTLFMSSWIELSLPQVALVDELRNMIPSQFTLEALRRFQGGPYAIKLAPWYLERAFRSEGILKFHRLLDVEEFTCGQRTIRAGKFLKVVGLRSRFQSGVTRQVFIHFGDHPKDTMTFCTCAAGARTVGACAHAVAALFFLVQLQSSGRPWVPARRVATARFDAVQNLAEEARQTRLLQKDKYNSFGSEVPDARLFAERTPKRHPHCDDIVLVGAGTDDEFSCVLSLPLALHLWRGVLNDDYVGVTLEFDPFAWTLVEEDDRVYWTVPFNCLVEDGADAAPDRDAESESTD